MSEDTPDLGSNIVIQDDPLDHDKNGKKGGSLPKAKRTGKKIGKGPYDHTWIVLEENSDIPPTGLFLGHNGEGCLVVAGEPVCIQNKYIEILDNAETTSPQVDSMTQRVIGHRKKMRFPYRRVDAPVVEE